MKSSLRIDPFVSKSNNATSFIIASRDLYRSTINFFNPGRIIKSFFSTTSKWFFFFFLKSFNRGLNQSFEKSVDLVLDKDNYVTVRTMDETLGKSIESLSKIFPKDFRYEGKSYIDKKIMESIATMIDLMKKYKANLEKPIKAINANTPKEINGFVLISEEEIWKTRNRAYEYKF